MSLIDQVYERIEDSVESVCYNESDSEIAQFFDDRTLFITGVTGFLGKCLLEKLLWSCTRIKRIYVLMRESKTESIEERTEKFFQHMVFDRLRKRNCDFHNKVTVIKGDLSVEGLGISDKDRNTIINEVSVIFHNAANVQFLEKVRVSLRINILGTKRMLDLAQECKNLDTFVYVSTAYSHLYRKDIEEKCYPFSADLKVIYEAIEADEKSENGINEEAFKLLLGRHPNIYTFTKAFSEELVRQYSQNSNVIHVIYRPSIVLAPFHEPLPGWWANTLGPVLVYLSGPLGMGHAGYLHDYPLDTIPSDLTVNALIAITRDSYDQWKKGQRQTLVYNFGSSTTNPATMKLAYSFLAGFSVSERPERAIWMDFMFFTTHYWFFCILHILFHFIPACIADFVLFLSGKKRRVLSIFWTATKYLDLMFYFANGNWRIHMPKTLEVIDQLNPADQQMFYCDIRTVSWEEYSWYSWRGLKKYILQEETSSEKARRRYERLWYLHYGSITISILIFGYYLLTKLIGLIS